MLEQLTRRPRRAWIRPASVVALALVGLLLAPYAMPILPPATFARIYGKRVARAGLPRRKTPPTSSRKTSPTRFGWDTLTQTVEQVYDGLPPEQRAQACVLTSNYGEAGALSLLAAPGRLPPIISGHNNYYVWGPGACTGQVLIVVGYSQTDVQGAAAFYSRATLGSTRQCRYCVAYEKEVPVYVLSGPKRANFDIRELWPALKHYD